VLVESVGELFGLSRAVFGTKEVVLPGVAAQDDVIQTAGHMKTRLASHALTIEQRRSLCN
jgi:hypothetical protein